MGHACNNNSNCNNYFQSTTPDTLITYTGPPIPALAICTGDFLSEVESVLLQKIIDFSTGVGIRLPDIDLSTCDLFATELSCCETCTDLPCLMQAYLTALCTLYSDVTELQDRVSSLLNGPYNTACLTGLGSNPTLTTIIQRLLVQFCELVSTVTALSAQVNALTSGIGTTIGNFLNTAITSCQGPQVLNKTGSGASINFNFKGFVPIGGIISYGGNIAGKTNSTGLGLSGGDLCGYALCNGLNGTVDLREQFIVGVGAGAMGGTGSGPSNIGTPSNYGLNTTIGSPTILLTGAQSGTGAHTHTINDPGHSHQFHYNQFDRVQTTNGSGHVVGDSGTTDYTGYGGTGSSSRPGNIFAYIDTRTTNITGTNLNTASPATSPHENRPPATALYYIQRVS